eukprot:gene3844-7664_t
MSFSDIASGYNAGSGASVRNPQRVSRSSSTSPSVIGKDSQSTIIRSASDKFSLNTTFAQLGESLRDLQKLTESLDKKISDCKTKRVTPIQKNEMDIQLREARDLVNRLRIQFESQQRQLESRTTPRTTETAQSRQALNKLFREYEILSNKIKNQYEESAQIRIFHDDILEGSNISNNNKSSTNKMEAPRLIQAYHDNDVDQAILEEREREIKKINRDLILVNEMFKDVASLVHEQGAVIEEIAVSTEQSHERARAGLQEVQKAAAHQNSCIIC